MPFRETVVRGAGSEVIELHPLQVQLDPTSTTHTASPSIGRNYILNRCGWVVPAPYLPANAGAADVLRFLEGVQRLGGMRTVAAFVQEHCVPPATLPRLRRVLAAAQGVDMCHIGGVVNVTIGFFPAGSDDDRLLNRMTQTEQTLCVPRRMLVWRSRLPTVIPSQATLGSGSKVAYREKGLPSGIY